MHNLTAQIVSLLPLLSVYFGRGVEINLYKVHGWLEFHNVDVPERVGHLAPALEDAGLHVRRDYGSKNKVGRWWVSFPAELREKVTS